MAVYILNVCWCQQKAGCILWRVAWLQKILERREPLFLFKYVQHNIYPVNIYTTHNNPSRHKLHFPKDRFVTGFPKH